MIALVESVLLCLVIALVVVTVVQRDQSGHAADLNPLTGVAGTDAFRSMFVVNFIVLPIPLATVAVLRVPRLSSLPIALPFFVAFFLAVEGAQYVGGGRVASSQDVILGATGATLAATYFGRLLRPTALEMLRGLGQPHGWGAARFGVVSVRRSAVTAVALLGPLVWVSMLTSPTPPVSSYPIPGDASKCGLADGEWRIPDAAPHSEWVPWHGSLVPLSHEGLGPVHVGEHGASCFARTPSGALLAASWNPQLLPHTKSRPLVGFRIDQANPDYVSVILALTPERHQNLVAHARARWVDGDWQVSLEWANVANTSPGLPPGFSAWGRAQGETQQ